jgi:hypothetical protein
VDGHGFYGDIVERNPDQPDVGLATKLGRGLRAAELGKAGETSLDWLGGGRHTEKSKDIKKGHFMPKDLSRGDVVYMAGKQYKVKSVGPIPKKQFSQARHAWNPPSLGGDSVLEYSRADTLMHEMQSDFNRCVDPRAERRQLAAERQQPVSWGASGTRRRRGFTNKNYRPNSRYGTRSMSNNSVRDSGERLSRVPAWDEQIRPVSGNEFRPKSGTSGSGTGRSTSAKARLGSSNAGALRQTLVRVEYGTPVARPGSGKNGMMGTKGKWRPSSMQRTLDSEGRATRPQRGVRR